MSVWQEKQGAILTGNNAITQYSFIHRDFLLSDLPHHLLKNKSTRKTFKAWLKANRRSFEIIGAWSRPIFAGGFIESNETDTFAFNLQSPSFFIDMRFSHPRPTIGGKSGFSEYSRDELFSLSQQHCFSGYSLPELPERPNQSIVFTRHHMIDWNFHPVFPRNRPNRWFIQYYADPTSNHVDSFKEYSTVRDKDGVPVYYERWQRLSPTLNQQAKYLVLRKALPCPKVLARENRSPAIHERRDGLIIVVGNHFSFVQDREYVKLNSFIQEHKDHVLRHGKGGGGAFIRYLINSQEESSSLERQKETRELMEEYLDLEGNYGQLIQSRERSGYFEWNIHRSTFPWNEKTSLFDKEKDILLPLFDKDEFVELRWGFRRDIMTSELPVRGSRAQGSWEVLECSFTTAEIYQLFGFWLNPTNLQSKL